MASADDVRSAVAHEDVPAGLVVPADFDPSAGKLVELVIDLGEQIQVRGPVQGALTGAVMRALAPVPVDKLPAVIEAKSPPGIAKPLEQVSAFQVTVPGNGVLFGFFIAMTVAMTFASERHSGTWRRLLAAPVPRWRALIGKLVPYYLIGLLQLAVLFALARRVWHANRRQLRGARAAVDGGRAVCDRVWLARGIVWLDRKTVGARCP